MRRRASLCYENPNALSLAPFSSIVWVMIPEEERLLEKLRDPATDLRRTAFLYGEPPEGYAPAPSDSASTAVELQRFSPRQIVWQVQTDRPRLLVVSEVFYPKGWRATVDNAETEIVRVNHVLRGVWIPAGEHLVTMEFSPGSHHTGLTLSWIATLLVYLGALALGGLMWYYRGQHKV